MKTKTLKIAVLIFIALLMSPASLMAQGKSSKGKAVKNQKTEKTQKNEKGDKVQLFNGNDLNNWVFFLKDQAVDPATVFSVKDGVIHIKGDPFGYMRTKDTYSDYTLHVEWRYPAELSNSGVFVHGQQPDAIWLRCIENQLKAGNAGDYVLMNGASINEQKDKSKIVINKKAESNEKPQGEWNTVEITCKGNTIETSVNGLLQNKGTGLNITSGSICLQSEGKDVEFRNVYLTKLKKDNKK
jgi:hypothetical protein